MPSWMTEKIRHHQQIKQELSSILESDFNFDKKLLFCEHHLSHAASAFYPSPFDEAAVLTIDGVGEWATTTICEGSKNNLRQIKSIDFPHSLGLLYSAFTYYTGFKVNSGEYKMMGLAPYGNPKFENQIKDNLINLHSDGSFSLNMDFFEYCTSLYMIGEKFEVLFGTKARKPETPIHQHYVDVAASIQKVIEDAVIGLALAAKKYTGHDKLCLAGGVALNCVANSKIRDLDAYTDVWVQPASGDSGGALGAALYANYYAKEIDDLRIPSQHSMKGTFLGPEYSNYSIKEVLDFNKAVYKEFNDEALFEEVARLLSEGQCIGWMQGRMEYGPRSLGSRSILADPRSQGMQKRLNLKIKFRESFRPFAPAVLEENSSDLFNIQNSSPYMLFVDQVKSFKSKLLAKNEDRKFLNELQDVISDIPAVTHVDGSARIQTVSADTNPRFYSLLKQFMAKTGCPSLVNTSFNVRGEPIVCSPQDAWECFMRTELDVLVIGNFLLHKSEQKQNFKTFLFENFKQNLFKSK